MPGEISRPAPSAYSDPRSDISYSPPQDYGWGVEPIPVQEEEEQSEPVRVPSSIVSEMLSESRRHSNTANHVFQRPALESNKAMFMGGTPMYNKNRIYFDDIKVDGPDGEVITFSFGDILNAGGLTDKRVIILGFKPADDMAVIGAPDESGIIVEKRLVPYRELVLYKIVGNL